MSIMVFVLLIDDVLYMSTQVYYNYYARREAPAKNARELYLESCLAQCGSIPREWTAADCKA